uniref:hypothetical protein n=1 Tax=Leuconostoc mesenteroides TaxID=1245 RepID=UPI001A9986C5
ADLATCSAKGCNAVDPNYNTFPLTLEDDVVLVLLSLDLSLAEVYKAIPAAMTTIPPIIPTIFLFMKISPLEICSETRL